MNKKFYFVFVLALLLLLIPNVLYANEIELKYWQADFAGEEVMFGFVGDSDADYNSYQKGEAFDLTTDAVGSIVVEGNYNDIIFSYRNVEAINNLDWWANYEVSGGTTTFTEYFQTAIFHADYGDEDYTRLIGDMVVNENLIDIGMKKNIVNNKKMSLDVVGKIRIGEVGRKYDVDMYEDFAPDDTTASVYKIYSDVKQSLLGPQLGFSGVYSMDKFNFNFASTYGFLKSNYTGNFKQMYESLDVTDGEAEEFDEPDVYVDFERNLDTIVNSMDFNIGASYMFNENWNMSLNYFNSTLYGVLADGRYPDDVSESFTTWEDTNLTLSGFELGVSYMF